jgi:hypothetical protein
MPTVYCPLFISTVYTHLLISAVYCSLQNVYCPLPTIPLSTVHCRLFTAQCPLSIVYCPLFTEDSLLPIGHYPMFTAYCPAYDQPTSVYCPLPSGRGEESVSTECTVDSGQWAIDKGYGNGKWAEDSWTADSRK